MGFRGKVAKYYDHISTLSHLICGALATHLGLPKGAMTNQMSKLISQLFLLHYVR